MGRFGTGSDPEAVNRRCALLADIDGADLKSSLDAVLELAYGEPDRDWLQSFLLECLEPGKNPQLRSLGVTCLGHVARLDGVIRADVRRRLQQLVGDPLLGGIAEDALGDVTSFVDRRPG